MNIKAGMLLCALGLTGCAGAVSVGTAESHYSYMPPEGYVPDAKTAIKIAEAVWLPIYGEKEIGSEKPFVATLKDGVWTVQGTYNSPAYFGGTALIKISKKDGHILQCLHGM